MYFTLLVRLWRYKDRNFRDYDESVTEVSYNHESTHLRELAEDGIRASIHRVHPKHCAINRMSTK